MGSKKLLTLLRRRGGGVTPIVTDGLVHEYRFDDGSGQVVTDYVSSANLRLGSTTGADTNDPTWVAEGLQFTTDDNCYIAAGIAVSQPNTHVICAKFTVPTSPSIYFMDGGGGARQILEINTSPHKLGWYAGAGELFGDEGTGPIGWKILTVIYNGASSSAYYSNDNITSLSATNPGTNGLGGITLGCSNSSSLFVNDQLWGYHLIYNKALSTEEIAQNTIALTQIMAARGVAVP